MHNRKCYQWPMILSKVAWFLKTNQFSGKKSRNIARSFAFINVFYCAPLQHCTFGNMDQFQPRFSLASLQELEFFIYWLAEKNNDQDALKQNFYPDFILKELWLAMHTEISSHFSLQAFLKNKAVFLRKAVNKAEMAQNFSVHCKS